MTASTSPTACSLLAAETLRSRARTRRESGPFEFASLTSWPLAASFRASVAPIFPAPMIPILMGASFLGCYWSASAARGGLTSHHCRLSSVLDLRKLDKHDCGTVQRRHTAFLRALWRGKPHGTHAQG